RHTYATHDHRRSGDGDGPAEPVDAWATGVVDDFLGPPGTAGQTVDFRGAPGVVGGTDDQCAAGEGHRGRGLAGKRGLRLPLRALVVGNEDFMVRDNGHRPA